MAKQVPPLGKIVYVCDDVLSDPANGKTHVVGAFNAIRPTLGVYPHRVGQLCVFAQVTGGLGASKAQVIALDAATNEEVFASPEYVVVFRGGNALVTIVIRLQDCPFPSQGVYLIQLFCQGVFLDDRRIVAL